MIDIINSKNNFNFHNKLFLLVYRTKTKPNQTFFSPFIMKSSFVQRLKN